ncbi:hypothetical protein PV327_001253 [Microctonus hyperodae]|uniref:Uncharacterized bromodomain-containing protein 10 helical domain-containing protein n=1 Tax=Microctonus hyperodae TaxID=165561 RepID=A0AA39G7X1_MICHY|nr:hypothetical protein PV327_001253 [Microctonus hyperodae]
MKMLRKRRNEICGKDKINDTFHDPLFDKLPDHVSCMWELPQIYEFLCFAKGTLHISNISMYEMERMLSMPKASKQLANIMTCLLSSSVPRLRLLKIPPMPYEFWTNVLLNHKLRNWIKIYENKEHDSVKVLDAIGVEPEFWRIFPDPTEISKYSFDELNLRQRVWLLKTVCDTMMHGKKSLQDELANRYLDGEGEKVLGRDRHGARYFYFPIFLDNDIRIYKHNLNNKILLNTTPIAPKLNIHTRRNYNRDRRRKKYRWKNGNLPQRQKKSRLKVVGVNGKDAKVNIKIEPTDEKLCNGDNRNLELNMIGNEKVKNESNEDNENNEETDNKEITNLSSILKSSDEEKNDGQPHPDNVSNSSKTDDEKINEIKTTSATNNDSIVSSSKMNNDIISKSDDEKLIETKSIVDNNSEDDKIINNNDCLSDKVGLNTWMKALLENKHSKDSNKEFNDDDSHDSFVESNSIQTRSQILCKKEMTNFNNILMDLSVSKFQLVADSVESLRELVSSLTARNSIISNERVRCEILLIKKLKALIASIKHKESLLKESTEMAREKLKREWNNFQDGIKDDDVDESARYASEWVLGSQGCPLLSCGEAMSHVADENGHDKAENEKNNDDEEENETKVKTETRRVLRARGVSSYMEQFSSDDDTDSSHPEGWAEIVDPDTGIHLGMSAVETDGVAEDDDETEGSGSDQDWILPAKRKRKSKRNSSSKRLKLFQNKLQNIEGDIKNTESSSSLDIKNIPRTIYPKDTLNSIKIESVHSEFHIKDEGPTVDPLMTTPNPVINSNNNVQPNYVLHPMVNTPNGPVNYVVMPNDNPPHPQPSGVVSVIPQVPIQQGYYVQNPQSYVVSNPQITQVRSQYINQENIQSVHGVIIQQNHQPYINPTNNYIQYQQLGSVPHPISLYPSPLPQPVIVNQPVKFATHSSKIIPRVIQNRQIVPPYRPRHPVGAVIRSTVPFRGNIRLPNSRGGCSIRAIAPRNPGPQQNVQVTNNKSQNTTKTTSLIVLSDSDDEIEMIIPQKNDKTEQKQVKNTNLSILQRNTVDNNRTAVASTAVCDQKSSSPAVLTPQIIQRMSQGGISITPIKPKEPIVKSSPISATQLVVVVNETGSHYALALPNGSKLILTPEQVAQIRASNGGKLVL